MKKSFLLLLMICLPMSLLAQTKGMTKADLKRKKLMNAENVISPVDTLTYSIDRFADLEILRYNVPDFSLLTLEQKTLIYYLSQAALEGRDILYDQNCAYNLQIRQLLEAVYTNYAGDRTSTDFLQMEIYLKRVWFSNGIHHHYAGDKFVPEFSKAFFDGAVRSLDVSLLPLKSGQSVDEMLAELDEVIFNPDILRKRTNQDAGQDLVLTSAGNYYDGVTQKEAEDFYNKMKNPADQTPVSYGLNSRLVKDQTGIHEEVYHIGGRYSKAIERIVYWLEKALPFAETKEQSAVISKLIDYYRTGNLKTFDDYCILWVQDVRSRVDFVNGFTETYGDPLGMKASWEANVNFKNLRATERTEKISGAAQWFEDHSPVDARFKKKSVKGVTAKVITAAILGGDCYPSTPIGINLPNSNWIRAQHGSKSVTIENITDAYDKAAQGTGYNEEFMWSSYEIDLMKQYGTMTDNLHTDLHECLGHASGQLLPGVDPDALKEHGSALEEARADLFGLYYCADPKMVELGILPNMEAYKAQYYSYMMNGALTQLRRIELGNNIEEAHMRNRALVANWVLDHANGAVELRRRDGKTYIVVNDYERLRALFGELLAEIQRIKSTGDYAEGARLIERYGVKIDLGLHQEILARFNKLGIAPYKGFVNPVYTPAFDRQGNITDVHVGYLEGYAEQHLRYSRDYSPLTK
ncbi:MAG: dihydrofolate reductase [Paludibacteraceae bacterium]|nr:dihydrofolate reductase [Paludibacteraceae bacterium]